jgi:signal transduction histidine kinase
VVTPAASVLEQILILAPVGRDASLVVSTLGEVGLEAVAFANAADLCARLRESGGGRTGAILITEEALTRAAMAGIGRALEEQPAWADIPLLLFTYHPSDDRGTRSFEQLGTRANVTMIERPIRRKTLVSAVEAALRARRRQFEVRDLLLELERRIEERDQFLAMLSHELRNPLAAISLAVEELGEQGPPSNERDIILRQTRHLKRLVDDLLDIARVTTGKISLNKTAIDFGEIVAHCVETLHARAAERELQLTLHDESDGATVQGDTVRLEQIVSNLLSNAIKYTAPGGAIDVYVQRQEGDAVLRVRDNGKGIAPEMLGRVFEMFMQGETTIDRSEGGMGVGLTLVRRLITQHGGSVQAYSAGRGRGSEFVVRLPLADAARPEAAKPVVAAAPARPRQIVVVEDNADIRDLLRIKLRHLGHTIDVAEDGTSGLRKILDSRPEVALVDIGLPGMDGYELARQVRAQLGRSIYLIALTGYGQSDDKLKALDAGFDVHLTKPADFADLQNVLRGA